jgi:hypothetical protein
MSTQQTNDETQKINLLNIQQVNLSFDSIKNEINQLCKNGHYDLDSVQKILIDLNIVAKALETLDKCQIILLNLAKNNVQE